MRRSGTATATGVTIVLPRSVSGLAGKKFLVIKAEGSDLTPGFELPAGTAEEVVATGTKVGLASLLVAACQPALPDSVYSKSGNRATFYVTPLGQVLYRPGSDLIDENDAIHVSMLAHPQLVPRLIVRRTSPFRVGGGIRVIGSEITISSLKMDRQAAGTDPDCGPVDVMLQDFAPGKGEIEIALRADDGEESLGKFDFGVNPLYTGALSFGILRSALLDTKYGLAFNGTDSVITEIEDPSTSADDVSKVDGRGRRQRVMYGAFYTHFFGRRDVEKEKMIVAPTVGFSLNGISDNAFVGVSVIVQGTFSFMGGVHLGRVTRLDTQSGLSLGSVFPGARAQIPTVRRWETDIYLGVALDVRAAAGLLKTAFGTGSGGT